jgi:DNA-directed RNA polymerase subunit N (RpoN/RPB10)
MLYPKCPTCGFLFADIELKYENEMDKICKNPNLTSGEKEKKKIELVKSLKIDRYCCKMRLISYVDLIKLLI